MKRGWTPEVRIELGAGSSQSSCEDKVSPSNTPRVQSQSPNVRVFKCFKVKLIIPHLTHWSQGVFHTWWRSLSPQLLLVFSSCHYFLLPAKVSNRRTTERIICMKLVLFRILDERVFCQAHSLQKKHPSTIPKRTNFMTIIPSVVQRLETWGLFRPNVVANFGDLEKTAAVNSQANLVLLCFSR